MALEVIKLMILWNVAGFLQSSKSIALSRQRMCCKVKTVFCLSLCSVFVCNYSLSVSIFGDIVASPRKLIHTSMYRSRYQSCLVSMSTINEFTQNKIVSSLLQAKIYECLSQVCTVSAMKLCFILRSWSFQTLQFISQWGAECGVL